uniref:Uncharacterized protein n=1 Tax=Cannabis sativa TaxID=3483 RepID=A0A803QH68_CANSA
MNDQSQAQDVQNGDPMPPPVASHLEAIISRPHIVGETKKARERYARTLRHEPKSDILTVKERGSKKPKLGEPTISFIEGDVAQVIFPQNDPLVITAQIGNIKVTRYMLDNGASSNILLDKHME